MARAGDSSQDPDDWTPARERMAPQFEVLVAEDPDREFDIEDQLKFFEELAQDYGPMEIGLSLGWSDAAVRRFCSEPSRAALIAQIQEAQHESVERGILRAARAGNSTAMKLYAYNKMADRGWADRSKLEITGRSQHEIVLSVKEALNERLAQAAELQGADGIRALQASFLEPDIPESDIVDAEIVED